MIAAAFNGVNSQATIPDWTPTGKYVVVAAFGPAISAASVDTYLLVDAAGFYISLRGQQVKARFAASTLVSPSNTNIPTTRYVVITVETGVVTINDGILIQTISSAEIVTTLTWKYIGTRGGIFSTSDIVSLFLYDTATPANSRAYTADVGGALVDRLYGGSAATLANVAVRRVLGGAYRPTRCTTVTTKAAWDTKYAALYPTNPPGYITSPTINSDFGETFAWNSSHWIDIFLMMHKATGDTSYLDKAKALIDYIFTKTDAARFESGAADQIFCADNTGTGGVDDRYDDAPKQFRYASDGGAATEGIPANGWRRFPTSTNTIGALIDGKIASHIARYCHYVLSKPSLSSYHADALAYLGSCATIMHDHDTSWSSTKNPTNIPGFWHYLNNASANWGDPGKYSNPLAFNHGLLCLLTMAICNKYLTPDSGFTDKITKGLAFFRQHYWRTATGAIAWWYAWDVTPASRKSQDLNHGYGIEVPVFYWLNRMDNSLVSTDEVRDLARAVFNTCEVGGVGALPYRIDATYLTAGDAMLTASDYGLVMGMLMTAAAVAPEMVPVARRAAAVAAAGTEAWNHWPPFAAAACDIALAAGAIDYAA